MYEQQCQSLFVIRICLQKSVNLTFEGGLGMSCFSVHISISFCHLDILSLHGKIFWGILATFGAHSIIILLHVPRQQVEYDLLYDYIRKGNFPDSITKNRKDSLCRKSKSVVDGLLYFRDN